MRILLVEDDETLAFLLSEFLINHQHEIAAIMASGEEAVDCVNHEPLDVVIMDINLEGKMNGFQAAYLIHQKVKIPVLFMSGYDPEEIRQFIRSNPYCDYLSKPVNPKLILTKLRNLLPSK